MYVLSKKKIRTTFKMKNNFWTTVSLIVGHYIDDQFLHGPSEAFVISVTPKKQINVLRNQLVAIYNVINYPKKTKLKQYVRILHCSKQPRIPVVG